MAKKRQPPNKSGKGGSGPASDGSKSDGPASGGSKRPRKQQGGSKSSGGSARKKSAKKSAEKSARVPAPARHECVVVGIGASAGGLDAFKRFLQAMPSDSGMAFVLIQHLDPDHESLMADLLSKHTSMPVVQADDATPVQPDHVYMIPPNKFIKLQDGGLFLDDPVKHRGMRMPIDYFFRSLAHERQERAIGLVLSGTGSDGTGGLKEIKAQGGMVMVQSPDTAEYDGMPRSALSTGMVDFVCAIDEMPSVLTRYVQHPYVDRAGGGAALLESAPDQYKSIINLLRAHTDYDFRCYKKGTLSRRIQRRMGLRHVEHITDYLALLRKDREEINLLFKDLLISVTQFFREREAWAALETEVIAKLVAEKSFDQPVRVWVPGCATGEEAYTIAILLYEQFELQHKNLDVQIFATDLDEDAVDAARQGIYPASIAADISHSRLQRFFQEEGEKFRVNKRLRESCVFAVQNLIGDPPFSNLDLVSCRNVMIYLESDIQQKMIQMFHFALQPGGYLFQGASESIGKQKRLFKPVSSQWRIYRKTGVAARGRMNFPILPSTADRSEGGKSSLEAEYGQPLGAVELARKVLLEKFAPASVVIDRKYEVQYFHGPVRNYLDIPSGEPTTDLTAMSLEGLRSKLRGLIHKVLHEGKPRSVTAPRVRRDGHMVAVRIDVEPLPHRRGADPLLLVSFSDEPLTVPAASQPPAISDSRGDEGGDDAGAERRAGAERGRALATPPADGGPTHLVEQLEYELQATREDLQSTIEELETSNEELKASNEEVMSMNEELQSTNEELETSREELQSLNEELSTVNSQLEEKVHELENTNNDLSNLLTSTEIATIFLDTDFRIRRFTPATSELLHVIETDIGRPVSDLSPRFNDPALYSDARQVLKKLASIEREVFVEGVMVRGTDEEGNDAAGELEAPTTRWFIRRILPYRTSENKIDGVVITFTDITRLTISSRQLALRQQQTAVVANLGRAALAGESVQTLCEQAVEQISKTLDVEFCKVLSLTPDRKSMLLKAGVGWNPGLVGEAMVGAGLDSQAGFTLQSSGPVVVRDLKREKRFQGPTLLVDHGVTSGMSVIIGSEDDPWGVLGAHCRQRRDFTVDDVNFIVSVANVISEAIRRKHVEQQVRDREQRLTLVTDAVPALIAYCDRDMIYEFCNAQYEDWFGLKQEEIVGQHLARVIGDQAYETVKPHIERVLSGEQVSFETRLPYRHGPARHVHIQYVPNQQADGEITGYYAMIEDISERVRGEQARARLAAIVEHSNDAIIAKTLEGAVTSWNAAAERMYGYSAKEMIGQSLKIICPDDRKNEVDQFLEQIKRGEAVQHFETVRIRKDGTPLNVSITVSPIRDQGGEVVGASAISRDITARKVSEQRLKELNETLEERVKERAGLIQLLHSITVACHDAANTDEAVGHVLRELSRYNGWCFGHAFRASETEADELLSFMSYYEKEPGRFEDFRDATNRLRLRKGQGLPGRVLETRKPEFIQDLSEEADSVPYREEALEAGIRTAVAFPVMVGQQVIAVLEFFSDDPQEIDDRVLEAFASIGSQLARVVERTRLQREIAELASEERQRLGSELHDTVIQQLTGSEMMAESLRQKLAGTDSQTNAAQLLETLKEAQKEIRRLHHGLMPVEVDPAGLMSALDDLANRTSEMHGIECLFDCENHVPVQDTMTATNLYRIAQEAVHNAAKHAQPRRITISLLGESPLQLVVHDDGRGMPEAPDRTAGSGLRIMGYRAEVIGAVLTVESQPGKGTTVVCRVPEYHA